MNGVQTSERTGVRFRPVQPADVEPLITAAHADRHPVLAPTHVADRNGEIVGYASLGGLMLVNCWMDSTRTNKFESLRMLRAVERAVDGKFLMACAQNSPFFELLPRLNYTRLGFSSFNLKT